MTVVGVTGTNGKTTTTHLLASILERGGPPCGVIGTLTGAHTTPEAPELQADARPLPRRRAAGRGDGGVVARAGSAPRRRHAVRRRRVHQPRPRPPRLPRHDGALLRGQGRGCSRRRLAALGVVNADDAHGRRLLADASIPTEALLAGRRRPICTVGAVGSSFRWRGHDVAVAPRRPVQRRERLGRGHAAAELGRGARRDRRRAGRAPVRCPGGSSRSTPASRSP